MFYVLVAPPCLALHVNVRPSWWLVVVGKTKWGLAFTPCIGFYSHGRLTSIVRYVGPMVSGCRVEMLASRVEYHSSVFYVGGLCLWDSVVDGLDDPLHTA